MSPEIPDSSPVSVASEPPIVEYFAGTWVRNAEKSDDRTAVLTAMGLNWLARSVVERLTVTTTYTHVGKDRLKQVTITNMGTKEDLHEIDGVAHEMPQDNKPNETFQKTCQWNGVPYVTVVGGPAPTAPYEPANGEAYNAEERRSYKITVTLPDSKGVTYCVRCKDPNTEEFYEDFWITQRCVPARVCVFLRVRVSLSLSSCFLCLCLDVRVHASVHSPSSDRH